jgi:hypothetical protein
MDFCRIFLNFNSEITESGPHLSVAARRSAAVRSLPLCATRAAPAEAEPVAHRVAVGHPRVAAGRASTAHVGRASRSCRPRPALCIWAERGFGPVAPG